MGPESNTREKEANTRQLGAQTLRSEANSRWQEVNTRQISLEATPARGRMGRPAMRLLAGLVDLVLGGHDHEYELVPAGQAGPGSPAIVKAVHHNTIKS